MRVNAEKYGIDSNRTGAQGFSAGGCLALIAAINSTARSYELIEYYSLVGVDFTSAETTPLTLTVGKKSVSETFDVGEEARELIDRFVPGQSL